MFSNNKKAFNRVLSIMLTLVMVLGMLPTAYATETTTGEHDHDHSDEQSASTTLPAGNFATTVSNESGAVCYDPAVKNALGEAYTKIMTDKDPYGITTHGDTCPYCGYYTGGTYACTMCDGPSTEPEPEPEPVCHHCGRTGHDCCIVCDICYWCIWDCPGHHICDSNGPYDYVSTGSGGHDVYDTCSGCGARQYPKVRSEGHSMGSWTYQKYSSYHQRYRACTKCGYTENDGGTQSHTFGNPTYRDYNTSYHKVETSCTTCGYVSSSTNESHTFGSSYTYTSAGTSSHNKTNKCIKCSRPNTVSESHSWPATWTYTNTNTTVHTMSKKCAYCTETQSSTENHTWGSPSYTSTSDTQHKLTYTCSVCKGTKTENASHTFGSWSYAKYSESQHTRTHTCSLCSKSVSENQAHTYGSETKSQHDSSQHKYTKYCTMSGCGEDSIRYEAHSYTITYKNNDVENSIAKNNHQKIFTCHCGYSYQVTETHYDNNGDYKCDACGHKLGFEMTWHWYDESQGEVVSKTTCFFGQPLTMPAARGRMDYRFTGWYTDWGGVGTEYTAESIASDSTPHHLYASWAAVVDFKSDLSGPTIKVVKSAIDTSKTPSQMTITITTSDSDTGANDHDLPIHIEGEDNSVWYANGHKITVTENCTIVVTARDKEGNTRQHIIVVDEFDRTAPIIDTVIPDNTEWTNKDVVLSVSAHDDVKLDTNAYRYTFTPVGGSATVGSWTSSATYSAATCGVLKVEVRDAAGNISAPVSYYVGNIDKDKPTITISANTTDTVDPEVGVVLTITVTDPANAATGMSSGLHSLPIMWKNAGGIWSTTTTITVHNNRDFVVAVRDNAGNTQEAEYKVRNISTSVPVVDGITVYDATGAIVDPADTSNWGKAPYTIKCDADFGEGGARADGMSYSWNGGHTWTSLNTFTAYENNKEYTVIIRDQYGVENFSSVIVRNMDDARPVVSVTKVMDKPDDWEERFGVGAACTAADYVPKLNIATSDTGSGLKEIKVSGPCMAEKTYLEANVVIDAATGAWTVKFDLDQPGTYHVVVTDKTGNKTEQDLVLQWTDLGESIQGPRGELPVVEPSDRSIAALVHGANGFFDKNRDEYTTYSAAGLTAGVTVIIETEVARNSYVSGKVNFNGVPYSLTFKDEEFGTGTTVRSSGGTLRGTATIRWEDFTQDYKNANFLVQVHEYYDSSCTTVIRSGSNTFALNVQLSSPSIYYTYNRATQELTMIPTFGIAGGKITEFIFDDGTPIRTGNTVCLADITTTSVTMRAVDNLGNEATLTVPVDALGISGGASNSIEQGTLAEGSTTSSYHSSNRAADVYIIGGTRGNTDQIPSENVFNSLLGNAG